MRYHLLKPTNPNYSVLEQILTNRGIERKDIEHYLHTTDDDINSPLSLGEDNLRRAAAALVAAIQAQKNALVIVDCDCDGFTSASVLINYLHDVFPSWVENHLTYFLHGEKKHGLEDCLDKALEAGLVLVPDAGSNDAAQQQKLAEAGIPVIILDHHEVDIPLDTIPAILINNQSSAYPNKHLSGAGVTWQFCRYLDSQLGANHADKYIDLVALGLVADMMSQTEIETKHLILKGLEDANISNPFIRTMVAKNSFSIGPKLTPIGAAFYIAPFVNAMVRSGELDEKELLFSSMLNYKAFEKIPSQKRGHAPGEMATLVSEAVRVASNVKSRQTKAQDFSMETLEKKIEKENLLQHQVLLFLMKPGQIDKNIAGLCGNKIMAKYQRPCCVLTKISDEKGTRYEGSARGCDLAGVLNFKDICEQTQCVNWATGHQGAFGLSLPEDKVEDFLKATDELLKDMSTEPLYYVDYIYENSNFNGDDILQIASLEGLWGKDMPEALVALHNIKITTDMVTVYSKKNLTLKITLPNGVNLMLFNAPEDLCARLQDTSAAAYLMDVVGKCRANEWYGNVTPQIFIEDYNIKISMTYDF